LLPFHLVVILGHLTELFDPGWRGRTDSISSLKRCSAKGGRVATLSSPVYVGFGPGVCVTFEILSYRLGQNS